MDLAKDLAWQKIFSGRSTNLTIEKSGIFFCIFANLILYFISFPDNQCTYEIKTENIDIKWALNRFKKL